MPQPLTENDNNQSSILDQTEPKAMTKKDPSFAARAIRQVLSEDFDSPYVNEKWLRVKELDDMWAIEWAARQLDRERQEKLCVTLGCSRAEFLSTAQIAHRLYNRGLQ